MLWISRLPHPRGVLLDSDLVTGEAIKYTEIIVMFIDPVPCDINHAVSSCYMLYVHVISIDTQKHCSFQTMLEWY